MPRGLSALIVLSVTWCLLHVTSTRAAEPYKAGDEVEVSYLNRVVPAKVVSTNQRGDVLAEFEWASVPVQRKFKPADVRYAYESGALARARVWNDSAGKFHQKAALIEIGDDYVTLRKPDKTEIKVSTARLSDSDQQFLKKLQKDAGPALERPPERPALEEFAEAATTIAAAGAAGTNRAALEPDPLPKDLKLKQAGVGFLMDDIFDRLGAVIPVGGKDVWLLAAVENNGKGDGPLPTRLLWVSLERQKIEGRQLLSPGEIVLDYYIPSHRLLSFSWVKQKPSDNPGTPAFTLWEAAPAAKKAKPLVRWKADSSEVNTHEPWARIIDDDLVLQRSGRQGLVCWDTAAKRARYRFLQESFFAPSPTLSGGRKYLFVPEDKGVRILESTSGRIVSALPAEHGSSGVAISEDGRKAAVLNQFALAVWDLTNPAGEPQRYQAEGIGTPFHADMSWVGADRLMCDSGGPRIVLFSLKHKVSLWNYEFDSSAISETSGRRVREIVDQHLVYGATLNEGAKRGLAVGAVLLPGPQVDEIAAALDVESLLAIKPGTAIRLDIQAGENNARVQAAMEATIKKNGWTVSPTATTVLVAELKRGQQQTIEYHVSGFGRGDSNSSASVVPYVSSVKIMIGDQVAWEGGTSTGAPVMMMLKPGQSVQAEVDRWQRPDVEFFEKLDIPAKILDPTKRSGLGTTQVTNRGLIVGEGGPRPPGANPMRRN
jgi:hypothetical protein